MLSNTEASQNYMASAVPVANANDIPQEVSIQLQQLAGDAQQEEGRNSVPPAENDQGNNINDLLIAVDSSCYAVQCDCTVYSNTGTATVKQLIASSPAAVNERCGKGGEFALMHAAKLGHTAIVQALLEASANVNLLCYGGRTALMWAARNGHTSVVLALLQASPSASVDLQSNVGFTALMYAVWYGHTAIVRALLAASANVDLQSKLGYTALMAAAWNGHTAIAQALLKESASVYGPVARGAGPMVDLQSNTSKTALMIAAANGRTAIVRLLLAEGANITLIDTRGTNAETFAKRRNQAAAILLLQGESLRTCRAFGQRALAAAARITTTGKHVNQRVLVAPEANLPPRVPARV